MDTDENGSGSISHLSTSLSRRNQMKTEASAKAEEGRSLPREAKPFTRNSQRILPTGRGRKVSNQGLTPFTAFIAPVWHHDCRRK